MKMQKMTDVVLVDIDERELDACRAAIRRIGRGKWGTAYSKIHGRLMVRHASKRKNQAAARKLESAIMEAAPSAESKLRWAWSSGDDKRYFPTGEIYVLFEDGTSQAKRKRILGNLQDVQVHAYPNVEIEPPKKRTQRQVPAGNGIPGFSASGNKEARAALRTALQRAEGKPTPERPMRLRVPVAKVSVPGSRNDEIFEMAEKIAGLSGVIAATPDFDVLGEDVLGKPQVTIIPYPTSDMIHQKNLVASAWWLVDHADLGAGPGEFFASRELVAVLDYRFVAHPKINYSLVGYDAADGDYDPLIPGAPTSPHGLEMCGVIGGVSNPADELGIAPGTVLVPVRPYWTREEDYRETEQGLIFNDYEEYIERYIATWVHAILRLWQLSHMGLEVANMSIGIDKRMWMRSGLSAWINWWLMTGNAGRGVFASASAGNRPDHTTIGAPARAAMVFAVGWGDLSSGTMLGNSGTGLEIVGNDGWFPVYLESGDVETEPSGGSSVASAMVAGTVSMMKSMNHALTAEEIKDILRLTTRKAPGQEALEDESGYTTQFGWGFLNAYYATDVVWRDRYPAAGIFCAQFRQGPSPRVMIQLRQKPNSAYPGKRTGMFWALLSSEAHPEQGWGHDRNRQLRHCDQAIDSTGAPYGELTVVGDFDGDYLDEIALQFDGDEFWPQFSDAPAHSFLVYKHDAASESWRSLGARSPYAVGLASPQVVFPSEFPMDGVITADLLGDGTQCLVAWQNNVINALRYDAASDAFVRITPENYAPFPLSTAINSATGIGTVHHPRIHRMVNIGRVGRCDAVLCIASFRKSLLPSVVSSASHTYLSAFVVAYDTLVSEWFIWPLSRDSTDTHILLDRVAASEIDGFLTGDFSATDNPAHVQAVLHANDDHLYYMTLHRRDTNTAFSGYAVYKEHVSLPGRLSQLRAGSFGFEAMPDCLAWLGDADHGNHVRFLGWNAPLRQWQELDTVLSHGRKDNQADDLAVVKGITFVGLEGDHDVLALLMRRPDGNVSRTYRWNLESGAFDYLGVL